MSVPLSSDNSRLRYLTYNLLAPCNKFPKKMKLNFKISPPPIMWVEDLTKLLMRGLQRKGDNQLSLSSRPGQLRVGIMEVVREQA